MRINWSVCLLHAAVPIPPRWSSTGIECNPGCIIGAIIAGVIVVAVVTIIIALIVVGVYLSAKNNKVNDKSVKFVKPAGKITVK